MIPIGLCVKINGNVVNVPIYLFIYYVGTGTFTFKILQNFQNHL